MSKKWRRYDVLLPQRFNDGRAVPRRWLVEAADEIIDHFGAASFEFGKLQGRWRSQGKIFKDVLARIVVDVPDTLQNRQWMKKYKAKWKKRLEQLELWMVSYRIEIE